MVNSFIATFVILPASTELFLTMLWLQLLWLWDLYHQDLEKIIKISKLSFSSIILVWPFSHTRKFSNEKGYFSTTENQPRVFTITHKIFSNWKQCSPIWEESTHHQDPNFLPMMRVIMEHQGIQEQATAENYSKVTLCVSTLHQSTLQCGATREAFSSLWTG